MNSVFGSACLTSIKISCSVRKTEPLGHPIPSEVQALMGYSMPMLTLWTYAHVMEGMGREAVNGLERSLLTGSEASVSKCEQTAILSHSV
jgi:hypothetical protein